MHPGQDYENYRKPWLIYPTAWSRKLASSISELSWEKERRRNGSKIVHRLPATQKTLKSKMEYACKCIRDYAQSTSLHGFKYTTDASNSICERSLWILVCCSAVGAAVLFLSPIFMLYLKNPIITTVESTSEPVWSIPFPAVTICNSNKARNDDFIRVIQMHPWSLYSQSIMNKTIRLLTKVGRIHFNRKKENEEVARVVNAQQHLIPGLMKSVMQPIEKVGVKCWWIGVPHNCSDLFEMRRTDEGFCWGFNSEAMQSIASTSTEKNHNASENDAAYDSLPSESYQKEGLTTDKPDLTTSSHRSQFIARRVNGVGPKMGLTILLDPEVDQYLSYTYKFYGFKALIHYNTDFPDVGIRGFPINAGSEVFVGVTAVLTDSTKNVYNVPMHNRECRYPHEKNLETYSSYSYENCFLECQVTDMIRKCNCTPYLYDNLSSRSMLCNYTGTLCVINNSKRFSSAKPAGNEFPAGLAPGDYMECQCEKSCESLSYFPEITTADFPTFPHELHDVDDRDKSHLVLMHVYFKEMTHVKYNRDVRYTLSDIVSAFGGIVSLFIGFSFVSAAELVYFFTIRPFTHWVRRGNTTNALK